MDAQRNGSTVAFSGILDERSSSDAMRHVISEAMAVATGPGSRVQLDLSHVKRANSCGILMWFKLLRDLALRATYVNTPVWLVEQFNMSDGLRGDVEVESFQAPFYCPEKDEHAIVSLAVGRDVPLLDDYEDFTLTLPGPGGANFQADFEPGEYFQFLIANLARFKSQRAG